MSEEIEKLQNQIAELEKKNKELSKWDSKMAKEGRCNDCEGDDDVEKLVVEVGSGDRFCIKHFEKAYERTSAISHNKEKIKEIEEEIKFQKTLSTITRFKDKNLQELIKGIQVILSHKEDSYDHKFSDKEKAEGMKVLKILKKIQPKSSSFIDRGVSVNENLILSGTVESHGYAGFDNSILLTALDQKEAYNAVARVYLRIQDAERLKSLLTDCLEHVRILGWIRKIEEKMEIKIQEEERKE